jgi:hypothetical protein
MLLAGCETHAFTQDEAARSAYKTQFNASLQDVTKVAASLHPACDVGGSKPSCLAASKATAESFWQMKDALGRLVVPPVYATAHRDVLDAISLELDALSTRDMAIQANDDSAWMKGNKMISVADAKMKKATSEYPS